MKAIRSFAVVVLLAAAFAGGYAYKAFRGAAPGAANTGGRKVLYWVDPMHPAYKSDKPGTAPDCGMKLEPVYADDAGAAEPQRAVLYYRDPKDHNYRAQQPGFNPETGNELEAVYADDAGMPAGTVRISDEKQQLIGVKFGKAEVTGSSRTFRTVGKVSIDESRIARVRTKVDGWIDQVFVDYVGQRIRKDAALLTLYSPEMVSAERELLLIARAGGEMPDTALPEAFAQSQALIQAARRRLELWGLTPGQINQVLKTGEPIKTITIYSPVTGYVAETTAAPGLKVTTDTALCTIIDTSQVQILADVFEYEVGNLRVGERAQAYLQALPGKAFTAQIAYIQPQVDATSPTYKVRLEMGNPGLALKPDMYAEVEFTVQEAPKLTVPADAVLDAGERKVVYIDRGNGYFEPRQVETGAREGDRIQILAGLTAGQRVVTSGAFLIDSESQLRAPALTGAAAKKATGLGTEGEKE